MIPGSVAQSQSSSLYLSEWHGTVSDEFANPLREYGYPSDYGLPVPAAGGELAGVTVNPLTDLLYSEESDIVTAPVSRRPQLAATGAAILSPLRTSAVGQAHASDASGMSSDLFRSQRLAHS
jgi:hypothetical protein